MKKIFSIVSLVFIIGFFGITHNAFAGTLTNFSYSADSYAAGATTNYTISFTNETTVLANGSMILRLLGPGGVTIPNPLTVDVTVDGVSKVPNEIWGGAFGYIRMGEDVPAGSSVVIVLHNIVNTSTPGTYSWSGKVYTADGGANAIDTPASISSLVVTSAPYSGAGAGTALDPYIVTSCSQLIEINNFQG